MSELVLRCTVGAGRGDEYECVMCVAICSECSRAPLPRQLEAVLPDLWHKMVQDYALISDFSPWERLIQMTRIAITLS